MGIPVNYILVNTSYRYCHIFTKSMRWTWLVLLVVVLCVLVDSSDASKRRRRRRKGADGERRRQNRRNRDMEKLLELENEIEEFQKKEFPELDGAAQDDDDDEVD